MTTLHEQYPPRRYDWLDIERVLLAIPLSVWSEGQRCGMSVSDGEEMQRERIATLLRRGLGACDECGK